MLLSASVLTSCNEDGSYKEFDRNEIYKHLSLVNVSDAKMIYTKEETNLRSGGSGAFGGVWKIDQNGNETKLVITGSDGTANVLNIYEISKLSDKILLMFPDWYDVNRIKQEWYNSHSDDPLHIDGPSQPHGASTEYVMLLNRETEKLYRFPENVSVPDKNDKILTDNQGNIYYKGYLQGEQILKLSPETMSIEGLLPEDINFDDFLVTDDGFIVYWKGFGQQQNSRVKCPGGRIYPILDAYTFVFNGDLYSVRDKEIIRYETIGNNELKETKICIIPEDSSHWEFIPNHVRNTMVINGRLS